jgi:hypothetical protein
MEKMKIVLKKMDSMVWTGLTWLSAGKKVANFCEHGNDSPG